VSAALLAFAVHVAGGAYATPFPASPGETPTEVAPFWIDREPVTNQEFLTFVAQHPEWRRDRVKGVLADKQYLATWGAPDALGAKDHPHAPVVDVSWFAARAFCTARGGRLPTEAEWELAAASTPDDLAWYEAPAPEVVPEIGGAPNTLGIRDLHGLVWEWVEDFGASMVASGCGTAGAADTAAYTTYMRYAFRSSLDGRFAITSLGFRCAYDEVIR
jgi:formylglycine-generating enzyme required for sulfatase activity